MDVKIDEQTWKQISIKLTDVEATRALREVVNYTSERLKSRIDEIKPSRDGIAFHSK